MAEETKSTTTETDSKPEATPAAKPTGGDDIKQLKSELSGVHTSAQKWKAEAESAQKKLAAIDAERLKAAEEKAIQAGEHESIIAKRDETIGKLESTIAELKHSQLISESVARLSTEVRSGLARRAMAADWAAKSAEERAVDGAWEAFIEAQRKEDPAAFAEPSKPVEHPGAGTVSVGGGDSSLEDRVADGDIDSINQLLRQMQGG